MWRFRNAIVFLGLAFLLLAGCATGQLAYGPRTAGTAGYEDIQLGQTTWQVRIAEVWPRDWPDMEKFALYRAAEVTEAQGGVAFEVIGAAQQLQTYGVPAPATSSMFLGTTVGPDGRIVRYGTAFPFYGFGQPERQMTSGAYYLDYRILGPADAVNRPDVLRPAQVQRDLGVFIKNRRR